MNTIEDTTQNIPQEFQRAAGISLHENMYGEAAQRGLDLTGYLETLDPSSDQSNLDAFERQLAISGIRINGDDADIIDRFFASKDSSVLFPEFISRSVKIGLDDFSKLKRILSSRVKIEDNTYKSIFMDDSVYSDGEKSLHVIGEGSELPIIEIKTAEHSVNIKKYGRYLQATYEAIRRKRSNVVTMFLRAIGVQLQKDKFVDAVDVLVSGDGNNNAATIINTASSGTLTFADMVGFVLSFDPYELNVLICNKATAAILLNITEVKEHIVQHDLEVPGGSLKVFGAELIVDESVPANTIIGLDRRFALQEVYETGVMTESERLIRRQIEGTAISEVSGFAKAITDASKVLDLVWS